MDQWRWFGKVAVVTGAGSGIGATISEKLVRKGLTVAGFDREEEKLSVISKKLNSNPSSIIKFHKVKVDVTDEKELIRSFDWVKCNLGPINVLINSAGIGGNTTLIDGNLTTWWKILNTNFLAVCTATREAVKDMIANKVDGHIVHINSAAGHYIPKVPNLNVYPASKYAVTAFNETLRFEFVRNDLKIKTTSVSPGLVKSGIHAASGCSEEFLDNIYKNPYLKPEDVADGVMYVLGTPPHVQVHELSIAPLGETF